MGATESAGYKEIDIFQPEANLVPLMQSGTLRSFGPLAKKTIPAIVLLVLLTIAIRASLLNIPFERDEGEYSYIAWRLHFNELPYRDWVDQKPPGIFWAYRLALDLPFNGVFSVHLLGLIISAASGGALFLLAGRFLGRGWSWMAAALFILLSADPLIEGTTANTELFMLFPLILSWLFFLPAASGGRNKIWFMVLCGVLTGVAATFKQVAAVNGLFLVALYPFWVSGEKRWRKTLTFTGLLALGGAVVWGGLILYFYLWHGLADFIDWVFLHNFEYADVVPWPVRFHACFHALATLSRTQALVWFLGAAGLLASWPSGRRRIFLFLLGGLVTSALGVGASGYFFLHYFQQLLPFLCLAAALGAETLCAARFWSAIPAWCRVLVLTVLLAILPAITLYPFIFQYSPVEAVKKIYPTNSFDVMPDVARRISQMTGPDDSVFIFGAEPEVLFYARRVSATRYIFLFPLYGPYRHVREEQIATAQEISRHHPEAALYYPNKLFFLPGSDQFFTEWTKEYLQEHFQADSCLILDDQGARHLIPVSDRARLQSVPLQRIAGFVLVRTNH